MSHSSIDNAFVTDLAGDLAKLGHTVWLDEWEIRVGDSIVTKIEGGIEHADFVVVVLSRASTNSEWVEKKWQSKYWDEISKRQVMVLPVLLEDCAVPSLLRPKKYADFRTDYKVGLVELVLALQPRQEIPGIVRYYSDIVDIVDDWRDLFRRSRTLDLVVNYAATWRNTFLKEIVSLLKKPGGHLRVVLPEVPRRSHLLQLQARRHAISTHESRIRVQTAIRDFSDLSIFGAVEVYTSAEYFNHASYLFDTGGVLALYTIGGGRVPTQAFVLHVSLHENFNIFQPQIFQFLKKNCKLTKLGKMRTGSSSNP